MTVVAITGATGRLGGRVARRLADVGVAQRLLVRDLARAPRLPRATAALADYGNSEPTRAALRDADTVLMVSASEAPGRVEQHRSFVDAAVAAGVGHLVYTSFYGASPTATFTLARDHWETEEHIRFSGLRYTFLRDNLYADFLSALIGQDGVIRGPAGQGRVAAVAQDDIADVAAAVVRSPTEHDKATYDLTGPQALTLDEIAATISASTGREVTYCHETVSQAYASRASFDAPGWEVDAWVSTYTAIAAGELDGVSAAVPDITGHPATALADLLRSAPR